MNRLSSFVPSLGTGCCIALILLAGCASSSSKSEAVDPFEIADSAQAPTDILDEPTDAGRQRATRRRASGAADQRALYVVPEAAAEPARSIDAEPDDWDLSGLRHFDQRHHISEGIGTWSGPDDASFRLAVDFDESHLYFWVDVTDDHLIASEPTDPKEGVVIWLGDPALGSLAQSLPQSLQRRIDVTAHVAVAISPDGRFARYGDGPALSQNAIRVATARTERGYRVEAAFSLEALPYVSHMPLDEIAFRVEVLDTDDEASHSPQKRLTMLSAGADGQPRFAVIDVGGLLPSISPEQGPPRFDALGLWRQTREGWRYETLEYISPQWRVLEDLSRVAAEVVDRGPLPRICTDPDQAMWLVEVYQSTARAQRIALVLCGWDRPGATCPDSARSQLIWTSMESDDGEHWTIEHVREVFNEPLAQCPFQRRVGQPHYRGFSMLPLDIIGPSVWGIGWHMSHDRSGQRTEQAGVFFVDPRSPDFIVGDNPLRRVSDDGNHRVLRESRVYLTDLNRDNAMDICEIESIYDQRCQQFGAQCQTVERGRELLTHIKTWADDEYRFEDYLLHRHDHCRGSTTFADITGYKVLLVEDRLGLLRAPR